MADYFGPEQSRVLNVTDRGLDNVVFQYRRPPLSSEWNLINQIGNEKLQNLAKMTYPSGWLAVEEILQDWVDDDAPTGSVNCSEAYAANTFKIISRNGNIAVVNGMTINVQGTNSSNQDNVIILDPPGGQIYDFVFLEVWRKLIGKDDPVYPFGNVLSAPYADNEIEWDAIGTETTKRIQVQYRIRTVKINTVLDPTSDVFDTTIYPIGGRSNGEEYVFTSYAFRKKGSKDIGLYVSGDGSAESKTVLNTVDGYVYAIPMFLVYRRLASDLIFTPTTIKRAYTSKARHSAGYVHDRPDEYLSDVIYKEDIVDYRHKIISSGKEIEDLVQRTLSKLVSGDLTTALKRGFGEDGEDTTASSGGGTLTKVERLNSIGADDIPDIGTGSGITYNAFKRRAFCNAELPTNHNLVEIPKNDGSVWKAGTITLATAITGMPAGKVTAIDGFYDPDTTPYTPITGVVAGTPVSGNIPTIIIQAGSNIIGTSRKLMMEFSFTYNPSPLGFKDVPREFLEVNRGNYFSIATRDNDVRLRFNHSEELLNYGLTPNNGTPGNPDYIDARDFVRYRGGQYTDKTNFGHELVLHRVANSAGEVTISLTADKFAGYHILGVKAVQPQIVGTDNYDNPVDFRQQRVLSSISPYSVEYYIVSVSAALYANANLRITLYTGTKYSDDVGQYSLPDSFKFFEISKQGKGVIDTYEMMELVGVEDPSNLGQFIIDSGDKPIISLAAASRYVADGEEPPIHVSPVEDGRYYANTPYAFLFDESGESAPITDPDNISLPVLTSSEYTGNFLPTKIRLNCTAFVGKQKIRVPVLVHSYVAQSEDPYNFYYKTNAYQGILGSTTEYYGKIMKEDRAIVTTLGSGAVSDYRYRDGYAIFTNLSRVVTSTANNSGVVGNWGAHARPGDYIRPLAGSRAYRISAVRYNSVTGVSTLTLSETYQGPSSPLGESYEITRLDIPHENIFNVVARMPSLKILASSNEDLVDYNIDPTTEIITGISDLSGVFVTSPLNHLQNPMNAIANDFVVGSSTTAKKGRNDFQLSIRGNDAFRLTIPARPLISYAIASPSNGKNLKVFQAYVFNQSAKGIIPNDGDLTGRLYALIISGEANPSDRVYGNNSINGFYDKDSVDLFEIVGRPIIRFA